MFHFGVLQYMLCWLFRAHSIFSLHVLLFTCMGNRELEEVGIVYPHRILFEKRMREKMNLRTTDHRILGQTLQNNTEYGMRTGRRLVNHIQLGLPSSLEPVTPTILIPTPTQCPELKTRNIRRDSTKSGISMTKFRFERNMKLNWLGKRTWDYVLCILFGQNIEQIQIDSSRCARESKDILEPVAAVCLKTRLGLEFGI